MFGISTNLSGFYMYYNFLLCIWFTSVYIYFILLILCTKEKYPTIYKYTSFLIYKMYILFLILQFKVNIYSKWILKETISTNKMDINDCERNKWRITMGKKFSATSELERMKAYR